MTEAKNNAIELSLNEETEKTKQNLNDEMSLSVTEVNEKKKQRKKKLKERKGRKCELKAGPVCSNCKDKFKDVELERIHVDNCTCYWCDLCDKENGKPSIKTALKVKRNSPDVVDFKNTIDDNTIIEFINAMDQSNNTERNSILEYMEKQDFDFVYFTWLKYSKVTSTKISKDLEFGENGKRSFSKVYKNLINLNSFLSVENLNLIEKIWGASVTYTHRNHTIDLIILRLMELALDRLNNKNESTILFNSKPIQDLMVWWTDRKILCEEDQVAKNLYNKISLIIFNKL